MSLSESLSLAELERSDSRGARSGREKRFLCPSPCCSQKPRTTPYRSLAVNLETGLYICHRCQARGKLMEYRNERPPSSSSAGKRTGLQKWTTLAETPPPPVTAIPGIDVSGNSTPADENTLVPDDTQKYTRPPGVPLTNTPGATYLASRGIPTEVATASGVEYCASYSGSAAVIFPFCDRGGHEVAVNGRYLMPQNGLKSRSYGSISVGVFATRGAWDADPIILVESAINALSLAVCGFPAIAIGGTSLKKILLPYLAGHRIVLAFDNDANGAGSRGVATWTEALQKADCKAFILRQSLNDLNDMLLKLGQEPMRAFLVSLLRGFDSPACPEAMETLATDIGPSTALRELNHSEKEVTLVLDSLPAETVDILIQALKECQNLVEAAQAGMLRMPTFCIAGVRDPIGDANEMVLRIVKAIHRLKTTESFSGQYLERIKRLVAVLQDVQKRWLLPMDDEGGIAPGQPDPFIQEELFDLCSELEQIERG